MLTRWPLPALAAWLLCWLLYALALALAMPGWLAVAIGSVAGAGAGLLAATRWRSVAVAAGFPLSLGLSGVIALPAWAWLLPLLLIALVYPLRAWRDAPLFPTPAGVLQSLPLHASLADGARVLDAGCGLGHGLRALRAAYPQATLDGIEWSWPLAMLVRLSCPWAKIYRGDMWRHTWSGYDLVYLFQRPESMPRAAAKAGAELRDGAWLVSLEFAVPSWRPDAVLQQGEGKPVWLYRAPFTAA